MTTVMIKSKVLQEIDLIPEDRLTDLYNFIHYFRLGLERSRVECAQSIMAFAGCWKDMPEEAFADLVTEVRERRSQAFRGRRVE